MSAGNPDQKVCAYVFFSSLILAILFDIGISYSGKFPEERHKTPHKRFSKVISLNAKNLESTLAEPRPVQRSPELGEGLSCRTLECGVLSQERKSETPVCS